MEDTPQDSNHYLKEWTPIIRKCFIKKPKNLGNKKAENFKILNCIEKFYNNAMRVFVGSADIANNTKMDMNVPHQPRRVETFRKKKRDNKKR